MIDTSQSFTVSAWVYLANVNGYQTFLSQDGSQISGFFLQLRGDTHQFAFTRPTYDSPKALGTIATDAAVIPQPEEWYHLTGVYDASAQTISLYVNGQLAQTQSYVPNWSADGALAVGRGLYAGNRTDFVSGRIDDVRAYSGALGASAIAQLAGSGTALDRRHPARGDDQPDPVRVVPGGDQPLRRRRSVRRADPQPRPQGEFDRPRGMVGDRRPGQPASRWTRAIR